MKQNLKLYKHLLSSIVFIIFIFLAIGSVDEDSSSSKPKDPNAWKNEDNSTSAYVMMQYFVKPNLKSPRSAKFPGVFERNGSSGHVEYLGNQKYRIVSYVDSQNSFGALIRTNFVCEMEQTSRDEWKHLYFKNLK